MQCFDQNDDLTHYDQRCFGRLSERSFGNQFRLEQVNEFELLEYDFLDHIDFVLLQEGTLNDELETGVEFEG